MFALHHTPGDLSRNTFLTASGVGAISLAACARTARRERTLDPVKEEAAVNLAELRRKRKRLRAMRQRRPELYGLPAQPVKIWQDYPDIPWDFPECADLVNKSQR